MTTRAPLLRSPGPGIRTSAVIIHSLLATGAATAAHAQDPLDAVVKEAYRGTITIGTPVTGVLDADNAPSLDGRYVHAYYFQGKEGDLVRFRAAVVGFEVLLSLGGDEGRWIRGSDGGTLSATLPMTGEFGIVVSTASRGDTGSYHLMFEDGAEAEPAARTDSGPSWIQLASTPGQTLYYDASSIRSVGSGQLAVWHRSVLSEPATHERGLRYDTIAWRMLLDCRGDRYATTSWVLYLDGRSVGSRELPSVWQHPAPGSIAAKIRAVICPG